MPNDVTILISRVFLAALFLASGFGILAGGPAGFGGYLGSLGIPAPVLVAWLVTILKIVAGVGVIIGFKTKWSAFALAAFTIGAAIIGHNNFGDQNDMTQFLKDFAIAGGFLLLTITGPGSISVDAKRAAPSYA